LAEHRQALATSWSTLTETEREVLSLRLVHELTPGFHTGRLQFGALGTSLNRTA
jgi:hypothetical protein